MKHAIAAAVTLALAGCTTIAPPYTAEVPEAERYATGSLTCRTGTLGLGSPRLAEVEIDRRAGTARLKRPNSEARLAPWARFQLRETAERGVYATAEDVEMLRLTARGARVAFRDKALTCRWRGDPPYRLSRFPAQSF